MSCLGKNFMVEPLVDSCPKEMLVTQACMFKQFDLLTCSYEEAMFANKYSLKMTRDGKIDTLCVWFDAKFDHGLSNKIMFSTGPFG